MKGVSVPNKTDGMGDAIKTQIATLLLKGSETGSVTEEDVQGVLKGVEVSEEQLNSVYEIIREQELTSCPRTIQIST